MKKSMSNSLWALGYQFIIIPVLAILSYYLVNKFYLSVNFDSSNIVMIISLLVILMGINCGIIYGIAYFIYHKVDMPIMYHVITGLITNFILIWVTVYFRMKAATSCSGTALGGCASALKNSKLVLFFFVASVCCYAIFLVFYIMMINRDTGKKKDFFRMFKK